MSQLHPEVSFKALEPGIIDEELIRRVLDEEGPKGEAGRLLVQDGIILDEVSSIRLEFLNILAIDHLWMMTSLVKLNLSNNIIEKIENLDALVNLKELSLSYNYIEKIENLDELVNLEILTLFENLISRIENLDSLKNLKILSIGNNRISDWEDVVHLRKFKSLYSLNMAGNPCCSENPLGDSKRKKSLEYVMGGGMAINYGDGEGIDPLRRKDEFRKYAVSLLPQLHFYEYKLVNEKERNEGQELYRHKLLNLKNDEERENITLRKLREDEELVNKEKVAWVDGLRGDELFLQIFKNDPYGEALVELDETMQEIYDEFHTQFTAVTTDLYTIGLSKKVARDEEEKEFVSCLEAAKESTRKEGEGIMADIFKEKNHIFSEITRLAQRLEDEGGTADKAEINTIENALVEVSTLGEEEYEGEELVARIQMLGKEFSDNCQKAWSQLMALETHLYEQIEDTLSSFERNLSDQVTSLIESAQVHFVSCREIATQFHEQIATAAPRYFAATRARIAAYNAKLMMPEEADLNGKSISTQDQDEDPKNSCPTVPKILEQCLENKDALQNMLVSSHDSHLQIIDAREDKLVSDSKGWLKEKLEKYSRDEVEGNRRRLYEIISVLNLLQHELEELQDSSITLPMLADLEIMEG